MSQSNERAAFGDYCIDPDAPILEELHGVIYKGYRERLLHIPGGSAIPVRDYGSITVFCEPMRFENWRDEIAALANLAPQENVVRVLDCGVTKHDESYLIEEWVDAYSLTQLLNERRWTLSEVVSLGVGLVVGLDTIHGSHVLHRNLSTYNVIVSKEDCQAKLRSCGCVSRKPNLSCDYTRAFVAPEVIAGTPSTRAADVYSLGVLLMRVADGCKPWPQPFAELVSDCTQEDPDERPYTYDVEEQLKALFDGDRQDCLGNIIADYETNNLF